jgi:hypothetical protein
MYFLVKNTLKSNHYHNTKQTQNMRSGGGEREAQSSCGIVVATVFQSVFYLKILQNNFLIYFLYKHIKII